MVVITAAVVLSIHHGVYTRLARLSMHCDSIAKSDAKACYPITAVLGDLSRFQRDIHVSRHLTQPGTVIINAADI